MTTPASGRRSPPTAVVHDNGAPVRRLSVVASAAELRRAQRELGAELAAWRRRAGLTQIELARRVHYGRSTIANVETGRQKCPSSFWQKVDDEVAADGGLVVAFLKVDAQARNG